MFTGKSDLFCSGSVSFVSSNFDNRNGIKNWPKDLYSSPLSLAHVYAPLSCCLVIYGRSCKVKTQTKTLVT